MTNKIKSYRDKVTNVYTIEVLDVIGWWSDASWLNWELRMAGGDDVHIKVHSEGGSFLDGLGMMGLLKSYSGKVTTEGIGFVGSAATMFLLGGDEVLMMPGSFFMIHEPETVSGGRADKLEKDAVLLRQMRDEAANIYVAATEKNGKKKDVDYFINAMADETWYSAEQALELGLITGISEDKKFDPVEDSSDKVLDYLNSFKNTPGVILNLFNKNHDFMSEKKKGFAAKFREFFMGLSPEEQADAIDSGVAPDDVSTDASDDNDRLRELLTKQGKSEDEINQILSSVQGGSDSGLTPEEEKELEDLMAKAGVQQDTDSDGDEGADGGDAGQGQSAPPVNESAELVEMRKQKEEYEKKYNQAIKALRKDAVIDPKVVDADEDDSKLTPQERREKEIKAIMQKPKYQKAFEKLSKAVHYGVTNNS